MAVELVYILLVCIVLSFVVNVEAVCPRRFFVLSTFDAEMSELSRFIQPLIVIGGKAVTIGSFGVFEHPLEISDKNLTHTNVGLRLL